jgi:regulator of protease activity HflC (stomatin/prohibitin superfamily)
MAIRIGRQRLRAYYAGAAGFAAPGRDDAGQALRRGQPVTVAQWQQGLLFVRGRYTRLLEPGQYRFWQLGCSVRTVDMRPWVVSLPVQEVPTTDGASVKVTVAGSARVTDAVAYVTIARDPQQSLYLAVQIALRDLVAGVTVEDLLAGRADLGDRLMAGVRGVEQFGIGVDQLVIKDIMLSGELKKAQAEVLVARAQGIAALERARGETAALRSLANAARLAAANPALLQLRLIQQLGTSSGNTLVFGTAPMLPLSAAPPESPSQADR